MGGPFDVSLSVPLEPPNPHGWPMFRVEPASAALSAILGHNDRRMSATAARARGGPAMSEALSPIYDGKAGSACGLGEPRRNLIHVLRRLIGCERRQLADQHRLFFLV